MAIQPNQTVAEEFGLLYHDPGSIATTKDMTMVTAREAAETGALPCTACFSSATQQSPRLETWDRTVIGDD